ncbi:MAG: ATP-binding protein involved in chromosome partitioning, partial [Euryarchaeota archaeon]|nr:ATP-binding protein involved in chromosome partitioning [Euryarchaeota archaeon]
MSESPSNKAGNESCEGLCSSCADKGSCDDPRARQVETEDRMCRIKHKIVIGSGKGGVGKSTVTVNLAAALQSRGYKVGILDADITGPNIPKLLGIEDQKLMTGPDGMEPADAAGIKVISMALLLKSRDSPVVWRGPMKMSALKQFVSDVNWGDLDFLLVDLPPGTSDEPISIAQLISGLDGTIIVTTPQEVALLDSRKAVNMFL